MHSLMHAIRINSYTLKLYRKLRRRLYEHIILLMQIFAGSTPLWEQKVITRSDLGSFIQHEHHFLHPQEIGSRKNLH